MNNAELPETKVFVLRITEGTRVVAEAPLYVYDKSEALRNFLEALPSFIQSSTPALVAMIQTACSEKDPATEVVGINLTGNHSGLVIGQLPSNGNGRHPGF